MIQRVFDLGFFDNDTRNQFITQYESGDAFYGRPKSPLPYSSPVHRVKLVDADMDQPVEYWLLVPDNNQEPICPIFVKPVKRNSSTMGGVFVDHLNVLFNDFSIHPITELALNDLDQVSREMGLSVMHFVESEKALDAILQQKDVGLSPLHYYVVLFAWYWEDLVLIRDGRGGIVHLLESLDTLYHKWRDNTEEDEIMSWFKVDVDLNSPVFRRLFKGIGHLSELNNMMSDSASKPLPLRTTGKTPYVHFECTRPEDQWLVFAERFMMMVHAAASASVMAPYDYFDIEIVSSQIVRADVESMLYCTYQDNLDQEAHLTNLFANFIAIFVPNDFSNQRSYSIRITKIPEELLQIKVHVNGNEVLDTVIDLFAHVIFGYANVDLDRIVEDRGNIFLRTQNSH